ncbi:MAG: hypothetical protein CMJ29_12245 [Phycisphaerae bacterium]|nr:hypothetical protein [Phycisphaerae bacterium]
MHPDAPKEPELTENRRQTELRSPGRCRGRNRRGLTLFEALIAIGLLAATVTAVMSALASGRQHSDIARKSLSAGLAVEMLMARVTAMAHTSDGWSQLPDWSGYSEPPGMIEAGSGLLLPEAYQALTLSVELAEARHDIPTLAVRIDGRNVRVIARDSVGKTLAEVVRFLPEPQTP